MTEGKCDHYWNVVHSLYGGPRDGTLVRRYCEDCGLEEVGEVTRWRSPHKDEFDETAQEAAEEISRAMRSLAEG